MKVKEHLSIALDFLACLTKVEAMRGANDVRRHLNLPPAYPGENFKNCLSYIQGVEDALKDQNILGFMKKIVESKGGSN